VRGGRAAGADDRLDRPGRDAQRALPALCPGDPGRRPARGARRLRPEPADRDHPGARRSEREPAGRLAGWRKPTMTTTRTALALLALALVASGAGAAKAKPKKKPPVPQPVAKVMEDPRIDTLAVPSAGSPLVAVRLLFRAGSIDDPAGKEGLAALTGLMLGQA